MSEKNFWVLLRSRLDLKMYRVENRVMKGMPDVHYIKNGKSGWVEIKYLPIWPRNRISSGLKQNQYFWLKEYDENKGKGWILIRIGRDFIGLVAGSKAKELFKRPSRLGFFKLLDWYKRGNMTNDDWKDLADWITK